VDEPGNRVVDQAKTKHLHSRLSPFGPFNEIPVISDVRESACPKPQAPSSSASCQWLLDNKDAERAPPSVGGEQLQQPRHVLSTNPRRSRSRSSPRGRARAPPRGILVLAASRHIYIYYIIYLKGRE
jgi:hypothetical protein